MVSNHFSLQGWVNLVVVLIVVGLVMGLALSDAEILNPWAAAAKYAQDQEALDHQRVIDNIEEQRALQQWQQEAQALEAQAAREQVRLAREAELKAKFAPVRELVLTVGLALILLELALILPLLSWWLLRRPTRQRDAQPPVRVQAPAQWMPMPPELIEARLRPYVREHHAPAQVPARGGNGYH